MRDPQHLRVWHAAMDMAERVYDATRRMPRDERFAMVSQLRRSAVSVPSNIAEGCGRRSKREFAQFLAVAAGSLHELRTQVLIATRTGMLVQDTNLMRSIDDTNAQLVALRLLVEGDLTHD